MKETIAHITDIHLDEPFPIKQGVDPYANWEQILDDLKKRNIKKVIFGGDIGARSSLDYFYDSFKEFDLLISPGNHDLERGGEPHLTAPQGQDGAYHFKDDTNFRYLVMDTSLEQVSEAQRTWLAAALDTPLKIILAVHHPILPVPSYIDNRHALAGRSLIQELLHQAGNEINILCGHYHLEDERRKGNIRQMLTPAASYLLEKSQKLILKTHQFGYRLLHLSPQSVETDVIYLKPKS